METAITVVILIGLLIISVVGLAQFSMSTQATIADSSRLMQERVTEISRTSIAALSATTIAPGDSIQFTLKNSGSTKLADFEHWDVILQYSDGLNTQIKWYPYGTGTNQWTVSGIYQSTSPSVPEVIDPGIFNPGEEMVLTVNVSPSVGLGTLNLAVIDTPNGVTASTVFTY
jgi:archaeal flagellar protein FlaF